jgi:hypothetical protein
MREWITGGLGVNNQGIRSERGVDWEWMSNKEGSG